MSCSQGPLRVLLLYGSLRSGSLSRRMTAEARDALVSRGAQCEIFDPHRLPLPGAEGASAHPDVVALRRLASWADAHVWCTPEIHGSLSAIMKVQLDYFQSKDSDDGLKQHAPVLLLQVAGGEGGFEALNSMRLIARSLGLLALPEQCSVPFAESVFSTSGTLRDSRYAERFLSALEQLIAFSSHRLKQHRASGQTKAA